MVGMSEAFGPDLLPHHVVLPVGRRQHDRTRPGELEEDPLEFLRKLRFHRGIAGSAGYGIDA